MGIVLYGNKLTPIGIAELLVKCPCCNTHSWADVMVLSNYFHFYWIPIFPFEKDANITCKKCGLKRYNQSFDSVLISNYIEVKSRFRHPWFTYAGLGMFIFLIFAISLATVL